MQVTFADWVSGYGTSAQVVAKMWSGLNKTNSSGDVQRQTKWENTKSDTFGNFLSPISYVAVGVSTFTTVLVRWQVQREHQLLEAGST